MHMVYNAITHTKQTALGVGNKPVPPAAPLGVEAGGATFITISSAGISSK